MIGAAVGLDGSDDEINKFPDAKSHPVEEKFANTNTDLAAQKAINAKAAEQESKDPDKKVFINFFII